MKLSLVTHSLIAFLMCLTPAVAQNVGLSHYDSKLVRLSEILGSLHYLDNLCYEPDNEWRDHMLKLIHTENPNQKRKARFYSAFNNAYHSFLERYYECTPAALAAIHHYRQAGSELSHELVRYFGN